MIKTPFAFIYTHTDNCTWDADRDNPEFLKNFVIGDTVLPSTQAEIISMIQLHWDCFYSEGIRNLILGFQFCINTSGSAPLCRRKPHYGSHEGTIIMAHIDVLLHNGWIRPSDGPWDSSIVLAAKPHQEHVTDIKEFIWRMCISYRHLNTVPLPFEYPIPCCDNALYNFGDSAARLSFISLDNKTGYHQICVRTSYQEKLALPSELCLVELDYSCFSNSLAKV
jgi:hypothetical protein